MSPVPFLRFFTISVQCATYNYPNDSVFHPLRVQWELLPTERYADRSRHPRANRVTKRNTKSLRYSSSDNTDFGLRHSYRSIVYRWRGGGKLWLTNPPPFIRSGHRYFSSIVSVFIFLSNQIKSNQMAVRLDLFLENFKLIQWVANSPRDAIETLTYLLGSPPPTQVRNEKRKTHRRQMDRAVVVKSHNFERSQKIQNSWWWKWRDEFEGDRVI